MKGSGHRKTNAATEAQRTPATETAGAKPPAVILLTLLTLIVVSAVLFTHHSAVTARAISFDDDEYLTKNRLVQNPSWAAAGRFLSEVREPSTVPGYYQPLTMISLMLDSAAGGGTNNLRPYHETSLMLHAANTILVLVLLYMLFGQPWVAALVGLLFGVHPITVETIPWIGERKTLLATFFALWCLIAYVRCARRRPPDGDRPPWWCLIECVRYALRAGLKLYATCVVLYLLALMAKPTTTPLPAVMLLMDFWPLNRLSKRAVLEKLPFLAIGAVFSVITVISQSRTGGIRTPDEYTHGRIPLILCYNIVFYVYEMVWPARMSSYHPFPQPFDLSNGMVLAGVIGTCLLIPALLISLRWTRAFVTGWLIFFVAIFPTMGVLGFTNIIASDKYAYLPAVGVLMVVAWLLGLVWSGGTDRSRKARRAGTVVVVLLAAGLLANGSRRYLAEWQTTEGFFEYMLTLEPNSYYLNACRGTDCNAADDYERAVMYFTRAIKAKPDYVPAYVNRSSSYASLRNFDAAISDCTKAIELKPDLVAAYLNRSYAYVVVGEYEKAWDDVRMCRKLGAQPNPRVVRKLIEVTGRSE